MHRAKTARRIVAGIALVLGMLLGPAATAAPVGAHAAATTIIVVDDHHTRVVLRGVPRRIVALAPNVVEILYALGVGRHVVGVSQDSTYPPAAAHKPVVVTYSGGPNLEKIIALRPDVLIAAGIDASYLPKLHSLRLPIIVLDPQTIGGILHDITIAGVATGTDGVAHALVPRLQARIDTVTRRVRRAVSRPHVYYEYDFDKAGGWTYGRGSFGDAVITMAGGYNVGRAGAGPYPQLSPEQIIGLNPQVIVLGDAAYGVSSRSVRERPGFDAVRAVQLNHLYPFNDTLVSRPGPRIVDGLEQLARLLHPKAFT
ncbi:MAG TPA: ABC transporter substrate-binding protein [Chloroflexota bacterium]|nr:ABC transporter substrate-binding protein [Chloroflexota bacterium]